MVEGNVQRCLKALNADKWMQASLQEMPGFSHQLTGEKETSRDPVATCLFLRIGELNERLGGRVFYQ